MEWQMRIALIIGGFVLVAYIVFDFNKKRKTKNANKKLQQQFNNISSEVDASGFDHDGVSAARPAINDEEQSENTNKEKNKKENKGNKTGTDFPKSFPQKNKSEAPQSHLVLSLLLQAEEGKSYQGKDFLPLFLSQGLRHGEMDIFHRHKSVGANPGPVVFSLANGIAPGTFNMDNIEAFKTPALALFMTLPRSGDPQIGYDSMVKTVKLLKTELGGEILDENHTKYTQQTHHQRLEQIQAFIHQAS